MENESPFLVDYKKQKWEKEKTKTISFLLITNYPLGFNLWEFLEFAMRFFFLCIVSFVWDNKISICLVSPPDFPLTFLVFELLKWPGYQKCSKMFKVFEFFGFESNFSFCKRLGLNMTIDLKKNSKKMQFFRFLTIFESNF